MLTPGHWTFLIFVILIITALAYRKQPVIAAAIGLFAVGLMQEYSISGAIQVSFRAVSLATRNLLSVILLIGMVVALSDLMQKTKADLILTAPLRKLRKPVHIYWIGGMVMWGLTLLLWPTPAVTLLGAVLVPTFKKIGINPLGIAVSLTIFGEGLGLSGDFIIQGAPSVLSRATGISVAKILQVSFPLVLISGLTAAVIGYWTVFRLTKQTVLFEPVELYEAQYNSLAKVSAGLIAVSYALTVFAIVWWQVRGEAASAITGGVTLLVITVISILKDKNKVYSTFVEYIKNGLKFSMGVFAPVVIMSGFFFMGTQAGAHEILMLNGSGYFADFATEISTRFFLNKWNIGLIIMIAAILGALDGSGFSAIPLAGGIAVALSQVVHLPAVQFAVLGQVVGIWTGAALVPWGFSAVTAAVTGVEAMKLARISFPAYLAAIFAAYFWTMLNV